MVDVNTGNTEARPTQRKSIMKGITVAFQPGIIEYWKKKIDSRAAYQTTRKKKILMPRHTPSFWKNKPGASQDETSAG